MSDKRHDQKVCQEFGWLKGFDPDTLRRAMGESRPDSMAELIESPGPQWWALYLAWARGRPWQRDLDEVERGLSDGRTDTDRYRAAMGRLEANYPRFHRALGRLKSVNRPLLQQLVGVG
ncbi:hypothetical protein [Streptacidiphilus rugosus]|uniref:hypothetical protein n=1 Tax=Streptacidiphilus rugosus TaxID=405783 RepID=UPI000568835D|nr:hypothetical protein [Streptacidiphilus rugosus]